MHDYFVFGWWFAVRASRDDLRLYESLFDKTKRQGGALLEREELYYLPYGELLHSVIIRIQILLLTNLTRSDTKQRVKASTGGWEDA